MATLSHGYLVTGILPIRIALPTLAAMLLGPSVSLPPNTLLDSFLDYITPFERDTLKRALLQSKCEVFPSELHDELTSTLAQFGCRVLPTPSNLMSAIQQVARYEFLTKPAAVIALINSGIPINHRAFWSAKSPSFIQIMFQRLSVSASKVNSLLSFPECRSQQESRVCGYLRAIMGTFQPNELGLFLRFVTGSCVCIAKEIKIVFNGVSGLARIPIAHTCSSTLELPTSYSNFTDFKNDFVSILARTNEEFSWRMDAV